VEGYVTLDHSPTVEVAAQIGVSKVNVNSDLRYAFSHDLGGPARQAHKRKTHRDD
jgi:fructose/tagatose bisphosphate aldolase